MSRIAFIGGGAMGEAMISAILDAKVTRAESVIVSDVCLERREILSSGYRVKTTDSNASAVAGAQVIVLAIKPQNLKAAMAELEGKLQPEQLVMSIVAGVRISDIALGLKHEAVVRSMPNMPAQVRRGITVWTATAQTSEDQVSLARTMLCALGKEIYVAEEKYLDMATAVSGSGPAYVFLIIEALTDAAVHIGFPRDVAEQLVLETIAGSTYTVEAMQRHPAVLKNMVTSPGGTTAEALLKLEEGGLRGLLAQAVIAAYRKTGALG